MSQLQSFLPALFDAFGNQSADVRKVINNLLCPTAFPHFIYIKHQTHMVFCWQTVVFCLVDIYIMLGKAFLPYLEGLNSTQLRLVTIYANRISQARTGAPIQE